MKDICGIIHSNELVGFADSTGCILPVGHDGPHEFLGDNGKRYKWETDLECDCAHCMTAQGDYCTVYWEVAS